MVLDNYQRARYAFSRAGFAMMAYILISNLIGIPVVYAFAKYLPKVYLSEYFIWGYNVFCQYLVAFPITYLILRPMPRVAAIKGKLNFKHLIFFFCVSAAISYVGNMLGQLLSYIMKSAFGLSAPLGVLSELESAGSLVCFIVVALLGPFMEELLTRKLLADRLRGYGEVPTILFCGILFGIMHCNIYQFFYAAMLGMLYCYIYLRSNNFLYPAILHCSFNFLFGILPSLINMYQNKLPIALFNVFTNLYSILYLWVVVIGIVLFVKNIKKVYFLPAENDVPRHKRILCSLLSPGAICFMAVCLLLFLLTIPEVSNTILKN